MGQPGRWENPLQSRGIGQGLHPSSPQPSSCQPHQGSCSLDTDQGANSQPGLCLAGTYLPSLVYRAPQNKWGGAETGGVRWTSIRQVRCPQQCWQGQQSKMTRTSPSGHSVLSCLFLSVSLKCCFNSSFPKTPLEPSHIGTTRREPSKFPVPKMTRKVP